jgi:hypothetical protein
VRALCSASRTEDGAVHAYRDNAFGQTALPPFAFAPGSALAISASANYSLELLTDGSIVAWGACGSRMVCGVPAGNAFAGLCAGRQFAAAMHSDGPLNIWGQVSLSRRSLRGPGRAPRAPLPVGPRCLAVLGVAADM